MQLLRKTVAKIGMKEIFEDFCLAKGNLVRCNNLIRRFLRLFSGSSAAVELVFYP